MTNPDVLERVRELRARGSSPKEIARALRLPPSQVAPLIRTIAANAGPVRADVLVGCWANPGWSSSVEITGHPEWAASAPEGEEEFGSGLVSLLVVRERGSAVTACGYLVDTWCLGVKDAVPPKSTDRRKLPAFIDYYFRVYERPPVQVPLTLAQQIVFGGIEYARGLGFEPHSDFTPAAGHLGEWDGTCDITFGRDGKPMYIQGPHDNTNQIMLTLRKSVGDGNFHFLSGLALSGRVGTPVRYTVFKWRTCRRSCRCATGGRPSSFTRRRSAPLKCTESAGTTTSRRLFRNSRSGTLASGWRTSHRSTRTSAPSPLAVPRRGCC
jgi:hypothetical protein